MTFLIPDKTSSFALPWKTLWIKIEYLAKASLPHALDAKSERRKRKGQRQLRISTRKDLGTRNRSPGPHRGRGRQRTEEEKREEDGIFPLLASG